VQVFDKSELERIREQRQEWDEASLGPVLERWPEREKRFRTMSGVPLERIYTPDDIADKDYTEDIGFPGWYPFTRGVQPTGYRGRLWTRRQVTGFATPEETNRRLKYLLKEGETGLNIVFDLPTHSMLDSDNPLCEGEVGRDGVPVDTLRDIEVIFDGIDIGDISTSLITAGPYILSMYIALAEQRGVPVRDLRGTLQNDMMSLYYTVNADTFMLKDALRFSTDAIEYCRRNMPHWNPISFVGYQIREMGCTAAQEIGFTLASAVACCNDLIERGLDVDDFAPRFSFFFNAHNDFFEEVCKFRAARRLWARIMREDFGAGNPLSWLCRFHVQTAGCSLTAQQPVNNVIRTTIQALAAVLGGANSLHTNSMDEAFALPSEHAVRTALRTQQVIAYESGVTNVVDPLGGSFFVERLTDQLEEEARSILREIDEVGGMAEAVERGWVQKQIAAASNAYHEKIRSGEAVVVGVNRFAGGEEAPIEILRVDPAFEEHQKEVLRQVRAGRDARAVEAALERMKEAVRTGENMMPACIEAAKAYATIEEMGNAVGDVLGARKDGKDAVIF
jgi:methylmalonyl-CoA mutase N-terminal domain/subunit